MCNMSNVMNGRNRMRKTIRNTNRRSSTTELRSNKSNMSIGNAPTHPKKKNNKDKSIRWSRTIIKRKGMDSRGRLVFQGRRIGRGGWDGKGGRRGFYRIPLRLPNFLNLLEFLGAHSVPYPPKFFFNVAGRCSHYYVWVGL